MELDASSSDELLCTAQEQCVPDELFQQIIVAGRMNTYASIAREIIHNSRMHTVTWETQTLSDVRQGIGDRAIVKEIEEMIHLHTHMSSAPGPLQTRLPDCSLDEITDVLHFEMRRVLERAIDDIVDEPYNALLEEAEKIEYLPTREERLAAAEECKRKLVQLVRQQPVLQRPWGDTLTPVNFEDLAYLYNTSEVVMKNEDGTERSFFQHGQISTHIRAARYKERMIKKVGSVDAEKLKNETRLYGAKGANLLALERLLPTLHKLISRHIHIPPFKLLPAALYAKWKNGEDISSDIRTMWEWMNGTPVHVRSSAVFSEDTDEHTGAGIYESPALPAHTDFDGFFTAVQDVYRSVDDPKAVEYRQKIGIDCEEEMGIVVQHTVHPEGADASEKGYINTVRPFTPGVLEISFEDNTRPMFCKDQVIRSIAGNGASDLMHTTYYPMDLYRIGGRTTSFRNLCTIGTFIEMHFGRASQIEFLTDYEDLIYLVQNRALPNNVLNTANITFPDAKVLYESNAVGIGDMALPVLKTGDRNNGKRGVVIFRGSYFGSNFNIESHLPEEGAVIILCPSRENGGHIETLCVERGLVCIFRSEEDARKHTPTDEENILFAQLEGSPCEIQQFKDFAGHKRIRIVANGLKARIYPATAE